ncbi:hypothetical protein B0T24DRAFT_598450 [Lasiosphaeria ovina]|uniref:Stress-response A/B barrel domain-containing protein n=1 Tax=Lasiosphaeria ovina TaxID=92902 RepID=A0AAE0JWS3_9PEZI|nr:hypothetical protein B0T24DRAFT_598450 [Lasiosphaeria ovina]
MAAADQGARVHRTTMFKIPDPENQKKMLQAYEVLAREQSKDGKPYILFIISGMAGDDPRSKGYTVVAHTAFASIDDMNYYDSECAAHKTLKKAGASLGVAEPPLVVYFEGQPTFSK